MRALLCCLVAAGCGSKHAPTPPPVEEAAKPPVEPERAAVPRWCRIRPDGSASCYGKPPDLGEVGSVVDDVGPRATVRVTDVLPTIEDCGNAVSWEITTETVTGDVTESNYAWALLFDYRSTARTRVMWVDDKIPVPGDRGPGVESIWTAFDDDQDDGADFIITYYYCDGSGAVVTKDAGAGYCMAYYTEDASGFVEQRVDIVSSC